MRNIIICCTLLMTALSGSATEPSRPFLIVGEELPPFEYLDADGRPAGINVEIIERVFSELEIPYEIRFYPWPRAWLMIVNGAADAVMSVSFQDDRRPYLHFTAEQAAFWRSGEVPPDFMWLTEYVFFINRRHADILRFESYEQLKRDRLRVAVNDQYSYDAAFMRAGLNTIIRQTPQAGFQTLLSGEADLFPADRTSGWAMLQREGLQDDITWLPKPLFMKPYLLGFARLSDYPESEKMMRRFYDVVKKMRVSGEIDRITAAHIDPFRPQRSERSLIFVAEEWRPFEYVQNGTVKGSNIEVIDRIMTTLRIPYEVRIYPWARAWLMAERGQADAVLSVSYNPARENVLYYTDGQRDAAADSLPHDYLWISRYHFFVKTSRMGLLRFESIEQVINDGYRIGLNKGYTYCDTFPADKMNTQLYYDTASGFMALMKEEIDLYPMDLTVGIETIGRMGMQESISYLPLEIFTKPYLAPFVKKSDYPGLESIMYEFYYQLRQMRASGALAY